MNNGIRHIRICLLALLISISCTESKGPHFELKKRNKGHLYDSILYVKECLVGDSIVGLDKPEYAQKKYKSIPFHRLPYKYRSFSTFVKYEGFPNYLRTDTLYYGYRYSKFSRAYFFCLDAFSDPFSWEESSSQNFYRVSRILNVPESHVLACLWENDKKYLQLQFLITGKDTILINGFQEVPWFILEE